MRNESTESLFAQIMNQWQTVGPQVNHLHKRVTCTNSKEFHTGCHGSAVSDKDLDQTCQMGTFSILFQESKSCDSTVGKNYLCRAMSSQKYLRQGCCRCLFAVACWALALKNWDLAGPFARAMWAMLACWAPPRTTRVLDLTLNCKTPASDRGLASVGGPRVVRYWEANEGKTS